MALDSLGLGLTLDTTLLEKADKTLENMHKNSKLIMQNLTRGFTAFSEGKIGNFTQVFDDVSEAMDRLSKAKVSPDFDTKGQEKYIDRMEHLLTIVEKMSKIDGAKFYDPTEVYATDKRPDEIFAEMGELQEYKKGLKELVDISENYDSIQRELKKTMYTLRGELPAQKKEVQELAAAYNEAKAKQEAALKAMSTQLKAFTTRARKKDASLTDEQIIGQFASTESMQKYIQAVNGASEQLAKAEQKLADAKEKLEQKQASLRAAGKEYQSNWRVKQQEEENKLAYDNIKEREKILQKELEFSQATEAERAAMLTRKNEAEIKADQKRIRDVQKSYENLRKEIQKGEKDIAELEASRATLKEAGRPTAGIDKKINQRRAELNKLMQDELEFRSSQYWPKLQAIDEKFNNEIFIKNQKALAKQAAKESRKDVTAALQYSKNAQSINEEKEAIKRLIEARDNLSSSTSRYKKTVEDINKRILAHKDHIEAVTRVEKEQNTLADSVINRYRKQLKALDDIEGALDKLAKKRKETGVASGEDIANEKALKARRTTIEKDILEIEKQAQGQLDVIREQHEAERAKKSVEETIRQNEREKQEYAKLLDDLHAIKKQKQSLEEHGGKNTQEYANLEVQEQKYQQRLTEIRRNHMYDRAEIEEEHNKKVNDEAVREFIAAEKEKQKAALESLKKRVANEKKYGTISGATAERLISFTDTAKNVAQHKKAIDSLQKARERLDNTDEKYYITLKKIEAALRRHHKELRLAGVESNNLMQSHRGLLNIGGQLARRLALVFSVSQLTQYFRKLVEVRGQFEKTEVALTSIIGDNQKAEKLMNQTIALAIKSPFTLQQLTGYTKQLAAYQVSYEELHSTTKMLADVSAGLGVEMDRLILAFGQVKAANYLRATEVRQFTEAGFNILGELADYYNELEGTMLSVGDVQEMVTKRMVDFADVEAVFHRVTEAGGMFYEMQSKQAETLAGQWTNLQDRIDVMFNEIGSDNEGMLKGLVRTLASLIDNWEAVADVLKVVVIAFALYKANLLAVTKAQIANNLATQESIKLKIKEAIAAKSLSPIYKSLTSSMKGFGSAMKVFGKANLWVAALTAVISSIIALARHINKVNEALAEQDKIFNENTSSLQKLSEKYKEASKYSGDFNKKMEALRELSSKLEDRNLKLSVEIDEVKEDNIDKIFVENEQRLQKAYDFGKDLGKAIARGMNEAQGTVFGFSFFGENLKEDAEDYGQSMGKLMSWGMQAQMESIEDAARVNYKNMSKYAQEYFDSIKGGQRKNESDYEWTKRRATALVMISKLEGDIVGKNKELQRTLRSVVGDSIELHHETKGVYDTLVEAVGGVDNLRRKLSDKPMDIAAQIKTEVDKLEYDPATKQFIMNDLYAMLHLKVNYVEDPNAQPSYQWEGFKNDLKQSREDLKKFVDENNKSLGYENFFFSEDEIKKLEQFSDALDAIQKKYDENKKAIEQLDGTSDEYSKAEKARLEAIQAELRENAKKWNYDLEKDKSGKDERLERLKNQISLIKEMNKEYEKLNKTFSKTESLEKVQKAYADTAKKLGLDASTMDFTDEGTIKSLEALLGKPEYAANKYVIELQKALDNFKVELGIEVKQEEDKRLNDEIQAMFDRYELTLDLKKLNLPKGVAEDLFNTEYLDLKGLRQAVTERESEFVGTDQEEEYKKFLEKIDEMERKDIVERTKTYAEYLKRGMNERIKLKVEELRRLKELEESKKFSDEQKAEIRKQIQIDSNKELDKQQWDRFRGTELYTMMFEDLEVLGTQSIKNLYDHLEKLKGNLSHLDASEVKEIVNQMEKLQEEMIARNPFEAFRKAQKDIRSVGEDEQTLLDRLFNKEKIEAEAQSIIDSISAIERAFADDTFEQLRDDDKALFESFMPQFAEGKDLASIKKGYQDILDDAKEGKALTAEQLKNFADYRKSLQGISDYWEEMNGQVQNIVGSVKEIMGAFGADEISMALADSVGSMSTLITQAVQFGIQMQTAGYASNMALGVIGWIAIAIQAIATVISAIANVKNARIDAQLEEQAKLIERQRDLYEEIEERVDKAYDVGQLRKYNAEMKRSVDLEIQALEASIALEKSRKNADEDQIADWQKEIDEARKRLAESTQEMSEMVGGIFDTTDFTSGFVDAWWDAMDEGMSGLDALNDHFDETMKDMVKKQAMYRGAQEIMKQVQEVINQDLADDYDIDDWQKIWDVAKKANVDLDAFLQGWYKMFGGLSDGASGGLSALQKGIQGVTEQTAQVIESLLNSMRFTQAESYTELQSQTRVLKDIKGILTDLTSNSPTAVTTRLV